MNPKLQTIQRILRDLRLLAPVETLRYLMSIARCSKKNRTFVVNNPDFRLPPRALAYDAYSAPDWDFYKVSGEETAAFLASIAKRHLPNIDTLRLLEWGCGPARVLRHIHVAFESRVEVFGTDYNRATINWCSDNIPHVNFSLNGLRPPLTFDNDTFDFIYSISVFTHLSETVGRQWMTELQRLVRPGGLLVITTNGDSRQDVMLPDERESYRMDGIVIRGKFEEGKKMFWACHSPDYLRKNFFSNMDVLEHGEAGFPYNDQDYWVLRKKYK